MPPYSYFLYSAAIVMAAIAAHKAYFLWSGLGKCLLLSGTPEAWTARPVAAFIVILGVAYIVSEVRWFLMNYGERLAWDDVAWSIIEIGYLWTVGRMTDHIRDLMWPNCPNLKRGAE